ncbi:MAG: SwmB domain-containing protein, partial [Gallionella sp.]|nr:SwmB domain-containing protein [Gallionella sp.]
MNTGAESAADPIVLAQAETATATDAATAGSSSSAAGTAGGGAGSAAAGAATGAEGAGAFALSDAALGTMILAGTIGVAAIASTGGGSAAAVATAPAGDTTAPAIQSMTAAGTSVVLTYNEALDTVNVPMAGDFAVTVGGVANAVTNVAVAGSTVTLTLTNAVATGAAVQVIYTDPTTGNDVNAIQDAAGNDAVSFTTGVVADGYIRDAQIYIDTNNNGAADASELLTGVVTNANGNYILPAGTPAGVIIATGGVNIDTGVPNTLVLKAPAGSTIISPLTTLVQEIVENNTGTTVTQATTAVVSALGLTPGTDLTTYDPLAALAANGSDATALAIQQAAVQVATLVTLAAESAAADTNTTTTSATAMDTVVSNLATAINTAAGASTTVSLIDGATITAAITGAVDTANLATVTTAIDTATTAIDIATNVTEITTAQAIALDNTNPAAPSVVLAAASDTGSSSTDNLTNDSTPAVRVSFNATATDGTAAVSGNVVKVFEGTTQVGTATLTSSDIANGYVDVTLSAQADGAYTFTATLADIAGNTSVASAASPTITLDTAVPAAPILALTSDTGSSSSDGVTSVGTVNVTGVETGASWEYSTDNGTSWTAGTGASFVLTGDGAKSAIARQTDVSGNVSASSTALAFTLDTTIATPTV